MSKESKLQMIWEHLGIKGDDQDLGDSDDAGTKVSTPESPKAFSSYEDDWENSTSLDDDIIYLGTTPPRTERNRKQKERNAAYCNQAVEAAKSFVNRKHRVAARCASLPMQTTLSFSENGMARNVATHNFNKDRKRNLDSQRNADRQNKAILSEFPIETTVVTISDSDSEETDTRCESLPPISHAVKVKQRERYMSVSSRKIGARGTSCRKVSTTDLPKDRVSFYEMMRSFLKPAISEQPAPLKNRSEEDALYQQELNEMLWLELQAWHLGQDAISCDRYLMEERKHVQAVYDEIMKFDFSSKLDELLGKSSCNRLCVNIEDKECSRGDLCVGEDWLACLSVWCPWCRNNESFCLDYVAQLLEKVDKVVSLFPSSKKLAQYFPPWTEEAFSNRYMALCVWYNSASHLRLVIDILGRRLGHIANDSIPWPTFPSIKERNKSPSQSMVSKDSGNHSVEEKTIDSKNTPIVRFEIDDPEEGWTTSSDPSQSTGSCGSLGKSPEQEWNSEIRSSGHLTPPPLAGELHRSSSHIFLEANPYSSYVENLLRNKGMKRTLDTVAEVIEDVMKKTLSLFKPQKEVRIKVENDTKLFVPPQVALQEELQRVRSWNTLFSSLGLPRFHGLYIFLASIPLHMMRECLKLRLEQMPMKPSKLTIQQLMKEYKEGIKFAVAVRQKYVKCCHALVPDLPEQLAKNLELRKNQAIEELDSSVKKMLSVYLEWLDQFILMLHKEPRVSALQRTYLQEEWRFVQATCPFVTDGESLAAKRFCNIAYHMLGSVADFLDTGLDDMVSHQQEVELDSGSSLDDDEFDPERSEQELNRQKLMERCRTVQELLAEAKQRSLRAIALAKMLRKDLEVALEGTMVTDFESLLDFLHSMNHILVRGHNIDNVLIFVPGALSDNQQEVQGMLQMQTREPLLDTINENYLLLVNCQEREAHWKGETMDILLTAECTIMLLRVQISSVMIVTRNVCQLNYLRNKLTSTFKGIIQISGEQVAPHQAVTISLLDMKKQALKLCQRLEKSIVEVENLVSPCDISAGDENRRQLCHFVRDSVHQGFHFGFEYHKEVLRIVSGRQKKELAPLLVNFGRSWIKFVKAHYSPGKGTRPRWAAPGLDFLLFISDPHNTCHISDEQFKQLRIDVEDARDYIIGSAANSSASSPGTPVLTPKSFRAQSSPQSASTESPLLNPDTGRLKSQLLKFGQRSIDKSIDESDSGVKELPVERVRRHILKMDEAIDISRQEDQLIGRVSDRYQDLVEFTSHRVAFSWQRGRKIGSGQFGKVYCVVNNNTGEALAMKVQTLGAHKQRQIEEITNELNTFQHISHPHLVKYHGFEIYNDEVRIFMEYCDEGTLERLAAINEGLPERIVRRYTRQLLEAVSTLHRNRIAHRDIKGANIFLADENNNLKLGDFGSAIRLRGAHTEAGERNGLVGTVAFMAPEIFRSTTGFVRASDIWSVGCVIIEMATGKRPWSEYDTTAPITFHVGIGKSPAPPHDMSDEGVEFLQLCFKGDPKERASANDLLDHDFVKFEDKFFSVPTFDRQQSTVMDSLLR